MRTEKRIYIYFNIYILLYIQNRVFEALKSSINFDDIQAYAKDEVGKYIKAGYVDKFLAGEIQHTNLDLDLQIISPIILAPQNIHDSSNIKCIYLSLGELTMGSRLPPRQQFGVDYALVTDQSLIFDRYILRLSGIRMSTIDKYDEKSIDNLIKNDFIEESLINCEVAILTETKNRNFDNIIIKVDIPALDFRIDEQQLVFLSSYLGYMTKDNIMLSKDFPLPEGGEGNNMVGATGELDKMKSFVENKGDILMQKELLDKEKSIKENKYVYNSQQNEAEIKNKIRFEYNLSKVTLHVLKTASPSEMKYKSDSDKQFLKFVLNTLNIKMLLPENSDMSLKIKIVNIFLFDFDNTISDKGIEIPILNENFQCLISSIVVDNNSNRLQQCIKQSEKIEILKKDERSFIEIEYYYKKVKNKTYISMAMNKLNLCMNLGSLVRINQYGMYYLDMMNKKSAEVIKSEQQLSRRSQMNQLKKLTKKIQQKDDSINPKFFSIVKEKMNKRFNPSGAIGNILASAVKKTTGNADIIAQENENIVNEGNVGFLRKVSNDKKRQTEIESNEQLESTKAIDGFKALGWNQRGDDHRRGKVIFEKGISCISFEMNDIDLAMPIEPKGDETLMFGFKFNLSYKQNSTYQVEKTIGQRTKQIFRLNYLTKDSNTSIMLSKVDFDILQFRFGKIIPNSINERLLSNFRMSCLISNFLINKGETCVTNLELNLEPMMMYFGFREIKLFQKYNEILGEVTKGLNTPYIPAYELAELSANNKNKFDNLIGMSKIHAKIEEQIKIAREELRDTIKVNITSYNNYFNAKINLNNATIKIFDNTTIEKRILLEISMKKMLIKFITNSDPVDSVNMGNALVEMISSKEVPLSEYHLHTMYQYIDFSCELGLNYFNIRHGEWEPFIEPWTIAFSMNQVAKITRLRMNLLMSMLNINFSLNSLQVINMIMTKYYEDESKWLKNAFGIGPNDTTSSNQNQICKEEIALQFCNYTGIDVTYWFEGNHNRKVIIKNNEIQSYSKTQLVDLQGNNGNKENYNKIQKDKFAFCIGDYKIIEGQDCSYNHLDNFILSEGKTLSKLSPNNNENDNDYKKGVISLRVKTSSIVRSVVFDSAISFINSTIYENIILSCGEDYLYFENKKRIRVPFNWLLSDSSVYIQLNKISAKQLLYKRMSPFYNDEETKLLKPTVKDSITIDCSSNLICEDYKFSKIVNLYDNTIHKDINIAFDCIGLDTNNSNPSPDFDDNQSKKLRIKKKAMEEDKSVLYYIIINPAVSFDNRIPFDLTYNYVNEQNKISHCLKPLEKKSDYTIVKVINSTNYDHYYQNAESPLNKDNNRSNQAIHQDITTDIINQDQAPIPANLQISLNYNGKIYASSNVDFNTLTNKISLTDQESKMAIECNILIEQIKPFGQFNAKVFKIHSKSIASKNYIFFFDYIITNRLNTPLYLKDACQDKKKAIAGKHLINPLSVNLLTAKNQKMIMKSNDSIWSKPFDMQSKGIDGVVSLEKESYQINCSQLKKNKNVEATDVAVIITSSINFTNSTMIIFEPRYLLINNLGYDIRYKQEEQPIINTLKDKQEEELAYNNNKRIFRLGLVGEEENWSGIFNVDNVEDYDVKIQIKEVDVGKYSNDLSFSYNNKDVFILIRVIIQTYDNGLIYIMLTSPKYPYMQINNKTKEKIVIKENKSTAHDILPGKIVPFVWKSTLNPSNELKCCLGGIEVNFSFSRFDKIIKEGIAHEQGKKIKYQLTITTENQSNTRTLIVEEIDIETQNFTSLQKVVLGQKLPKITKCCISLQGIGLSLIDEYPREVFYISFYGIDIKCSNNFLKNDYMIEDTVNLLVYMKNFQIDYCFNNSFKNIIYPKTQILPSNEEILFNDKENQVYPFFQMLICMQSTHNTLNNEELIKYPQIDCTIQEFNIKIEQFAIFNLLNLTNSYMETIDFYKTAQPEKKETIIDYLKEEQSLQIVIEVPREKLGSENENERKMLINYLLLAAMKINLTLRIDLSNMNISMVPGFVMRIFGTLGNTLARITDSPLRFSEMLYENVFIDANRIVLLLVQHYKRQGIRQIYKILGSSDLLGNPAKLIDNIGTGFVELFNEPRKGFLRGPAQFGKGLAKGISSLVSGVVGGSFEVIGTISGTLLSAMHNLTGNTDELNYDKEEPDNLVEGMFEGIKGGLIELGKGFSGIFLDPYRNAKTDGVKGLFKGIGTGLLGAIIAPFAALFKIISSLSIGMKNTVTTFTRSRVRTVRFRYPRVIIENEPIQIYNEDLAEANEMLTTLVDNGMHQKIIYYADFQCEERSYKDKLSTLILSNCVLVVVYAGKTVIFKMQLKKLIKCEVHALNGQFILVFSMLNGKKKAIRLNDQTICCQVYEYLKHITG